MGTDDDDDDDVEEQQSPSRRFYAVNTNNINITRDADAQPIIVKYVMNW